MGVVLIIKSKNNFKNIMHERVKYFFFQTCCRYTAIYLYAWLVSWNRIGKEELASPIMVNDGEGAFLSFSRPSYLVVEIQNRCRIGRLMLMGLAQPLLLAELEREYSKSKKKGTTNTNKIPWKFLFLLFPFFWLSYCISLFLFCFLSSQRVPWDVLCGREVCTAKP